MYSFNTVVLLFIVSSFIGVIYTQDGNQQQPDQNLVWLGQEDPYVLKLPKLVNVNMSGEVKVVLSNVGQIAQTRESCNGIAAADLETFQLKISSEVASIKKEISEDKQNMKNLKEKIEDVHDILKENHDNISSEITSIKKEISEDKQNMKKKIEDLHDVLKEIKDAIKEIRKNVSSEITGIKKETSGINVLGDVHQRIMEKYKETIIKEFEDGIKEIRKRVSSEVANITSTSMYIPKSCKEIYKKGNRTSGVYRILSRSMPKAFDVFCDMKTRDGGWTVIQNRFNGNQDFDLTWNEYKDGFGDLNKEFWIGLEKIYQMTSYEKNELLVEIAYPDGTQFYARYAEFGIGPESTGYNLTIVDGYSGTGDLLLYCRGYNFSTKDSNRAGGRDVYSGGWWLFSGTWSNFNGKYGYLSDSDRYKSSFWYGARQWTSLAKTKMLIRPV